MSNSTGPTQKHENEKHAMIWILFIGTMALSLWATWRVKSVYARHNQCVVRSGLTGAEVAAEILQRKGMKHKLILESLADLPADALSFVAFAPGHAIQATKHLLASPVRATRRQRRAAQRRSGEFIAAINERCIAPLDNVQPWSRGGINE